MKKLQQKLALLAAALTVSASLMACSGTRADVQQTEKERDKPTIAKQTETSPQAATTPAATKDAADKIGVAECDEYIQKYEACIVSRVPEAQRAMLESSLTQSRQAWKQAAAAPQGKTALAQACKQAMEMAKQSTAAYSCAW